MRMINKNRTLRTVGVLLCCALLATTFQVEKSDEPVSIPVSAKSVEELRTEKEQNAAKIAEKQKELESLGSDQTQKEEYQKTLSEKITLQQTNIQIIDEELTRIQTSISDKEAEISQTEDDIVVMEQDIAVGLEEFKLRLRAMYVTGNGSLASALVGATDFYDLLSKYELISRVANHDNDLVNDLKDKLDACNEKKAELETEKAELSEQQQAETEKKDEFTQEMETLQTDYSQSEEELDRIAREQELVNHDIAALNERNEQLDAEEKQIQEAIRKAQEEAERKAKEEQQRKEQEAAAAAAEEARRQQEAANNASNNNSNNSSSDNNSNSSNTNNGGSNDNSNTGGGDNGGSTVTPSGGGFVWPCPGFYALSSGYGTRWGTVHGGIDIAGGNAGAAVVAAKSGTVIRAVSGCTHNYPKSSSCGCGGGYGNYVIIQHDGTYSTVYGHMQSLAVSEGDYVSAGQTIGYVGTTGFSTGYHLHFEIRVNGSRVDPMNYL